MKQTRLNVFIIHINVNIIQSEWRNSMFFLYYWKEENDVETWRYVTMARWRSAASKSSELYK